jgi:hypothetical protein
MSNVKMDADVSEIVETPSSEGLTVRVIHIQIDITVRSVSTSVIMDSQHFNFRI